MGKLTVDSQHWAGFWKYVYDRQVIWHRRFAQKLPRPWTDDPVLRDYSFTNAYRELDRGTQFAIENVLNTPGCISHATAPDMLCRIVTYRWFNRTEVWDHLAGVMNNPLREYNKELVDVLEEKLREFATTVGPVFTGAYMVCSYHTYPGRDKIEKVCNFLRYFFQNKGRIYRELCEQPTPEKAHEYLQTLPGVGPFNAYEFYSDMMYLPGYLPHKENDWANPGPGAKRGLRLIFPDRTDYAGMIFQLRDEQHAAFDALGLEFEVVALRNADGSVRWLSMRNIEHNLCEYSKYARGRARVKFAPRATTTGDYIGQIA